LSTSAFTPLGTHEFRIEGAILHVKWVGEFTVSDMQRLNELITELHKAHKLVFQLVDGSRGHGLSAEARRWSVAHTSALNRADGIACFGFNSMMRAISTLLVRAIAIVSKQSAPIRFFAAECEARAWLDELRGGAATGEPPPPQG
jgi:hypothetical protein